MAGCCFLALCFGEVLAFGEASFLLFLLRRLFFGLLVSLDDTLLPFKLDMDSLSVIFFFDSVSVLASVFGAFSLAWLKVFLNSFKSLVFYCVKF